MDANGTHLSGADEDVGTRSAFAYAVLESAILNGDLKPGAKLNEPDLAARFGISRGPLREAILRLEGRKLVKRVAHAGSSVVNLSTADLLELFQIREVLEGLACRLATETMTDKELDGLEVIIAELAGVSATEVGDSPLVSAEMEFHTAIIEGSRSRRLHDAILGEVYPLVRMYQYRVQKSLGRLRQALSEHRGILVAMRARDADQAEDLMRRHIRNARINMINSESRANG